MKKVLLILIIISQALASSDWGWELTEVKTVKKEKDKESLPVKLIGYYQKKISPVQGSRCPMYPTCSHYTKEAIEVFGPVIGIVMGVERMYFRENRGLFSKDSLYERTIIDGHRRFYDTIWANNIFTENYWFFYNPDYFINPLKGE